MPADIQSDLEFHNMHGSAFVGRNLVCPWTCGDAESPPMSSVWALQVRQMKEVEPPERKGTLEKEELDLKIRIKGKQEKLTFNCCGSHHF